MSEWDPAGKFDDLGFVYDNEYENGQIYHLLQAKHSWSDNKEITENDLLIEKNDFSMQKYFISYRETIKNEEFTRPNTEIKDLIIFTNRNPDEFLIRKLQEITDDDDILDNKKYHENSKRYKIGVGELKDNIVSILKATSDFHKLSRILATNKSLDFKNDKFLQIYQNVLKRDIIEISHEKNGHIFIKFKETFINTNSDEFNRFKSIFLENVCKDNLLNLDEIDKINALVNWEKLTFHFNSKDPQIISETFVKEFAKEIVNAKGLEVIYLSKKNPIINKEIELLKEIMIKCDRVENQFYFTSDFFSSKKLTSNVLNIFKNDLAKELQRLNVEFSQNKYKFHIIDFLCNNKTNLPKDDVTEDEINDFLDKLTLAVNQPNEEELDKILEMEITDNEDIAIASEFLYNNFQKYMLDWLKKKDSNVLTSKTNDVTFFSELYLKMSKIVLSCNSLNFIKIIEHLDITFNNDATNELNLKDFLKDTSQTKTILRITSDQIELSSAKIYQILKDLYKSKNDYNFLNFNSIDFLRKYVIQTFDSDNNNCLVIVCKEEDVSDYLVLKKFLDDIQTTIIEHNKTVDEANKNNNEENRIRYFNKKVILIMDDPNFKNSGYEEFRDKKINFVDLSSDSQIKIKNKYVKFQGAEIKLYTLILNEKIKNAINGRVLYQLIKKENIDIGTELNDVENIEDYYIHRSFNRQVVINNDFKNETEKFYTIEITTQNYEQDLVVSPKNIATIFNEVIITKYQKYNMHWLQVRGDDSVWHQSNGISTYKIISEERAKIINENLKKTQNKFLIIDVTETNVDQNIVLFTDHIDDDPFIDLCVELKKGSIYWFKREENNLILWTSHGVPSIVYDFQEIKKILTETFKEEMRSFLIIEFAELNSQHDVVLVTDENFDTGQNFNLCNKFIAHNIHWLKKKDNKLKWEKSSNSLEKLQDYVCHNNKNSERFDKIEKITDISDKVVIIVAEPGMGKSTLLTHLAIKSKTGNQILWILRINLIDYSKRLNDYKIDDLTNDAIKFLCSCAVNGNNKSLVLFEKELFDHFYMNGNVVLLFDGFDEINPHYKDKVIVLLKALKKTAVKNLWLTTRPYGIQNQLENVLITFSYSLIAFSKDNQVNFLKNYWKTNLKSNNTSDYSDVFINDLLKRFFDTTNDSKEEFVQIPLQIRMIADVFQDMFQEFCNSGNQKLPNKLQQRIVEKLNLVNLYESFINIKFDKIFIKNTGMNSDIPSVKIIIEKERKDFIEKHQKLALFGLFGEQAKNLFKDVKDQVILDLYKKFGVVGLNILEFNEVKLMNDITLCNEKTGIIDRIIDNKPIFVHKSFAEYFAALWLAVNWENQPRIKYFIRDNILKDENKVIRIFFDLMMVQDVLENYSENGNIKISKYEMHIAVLNNDGITLTELLVSKNVEVHINSIDKAGRTPLHLAFGYGYTEMVDALLDPQYRKIIHNIDLKDKIFESSALIYAEKWKNWRIAELLLNEGANNYQILIATSNSIENSYFLKDLLIEFMETGYVNLAYVLLAKGFKGLAEDLDDGFVIYSAALVGNFDLFKMYIEKTINFNVNIKIFILYREYILHGAVKGGNLKIVQYLVEKGANNNFISQSGKTPLHLAIEKGFKGIAKYLIKHGNIKLQSGQVRQKGKKCQNLIHFTIKWGNIDI